jgi:hypothetical protein
MGELTSYVRALLVPGSWVTTTFALGAEFTLDRSAFVYADEEGRRHELFRPPLVAGFVELGVGIWIH